MSGKHKMGAARSCILFTAFVVAAGTSFLLSFFVYSTVDCLLGLTGNIYDEKMLMLLIMAINCIILVHGWAGLLLARKKCKIQCIISTWLVFSMCFIYGFLYILLISGERLATITKALTILILIIFLLAFKTVYDYEKEFLNVNERNTILEFSQIDESVVGVISN